MSTDASFVALPRATDALQRLYDADLRNMGFVMNVSQVWGHLPEVKIALFDVIDQTVAAAGLTMRQRGVLISACASTLGDSYCSLAWGKRLADEAGDEVAAAVLTGDDDGLEATERALAAWARRVTREPNASSSDDVQALRDAGFDDTQIVAITVFVALRMAFSTVNDALGARPDAELGDSAPAAVRDVVTYGRPTA